MTDYVQLIKASYQLNEHLIKLGQLYFFKYLKITKAKGFTANEPSYLDDELSIAKLDEDGEYAQVKCKWGYSSYGEWQENCYYVCFSHEELAAEDIEAMINEKVKKATVELVTQQQLKAEQQRQQAERKKEHERIVRHQQYLKLKTEFEGT